MSPTVPGGETPEGRTDSRNRCAAAPRPPADALQLRVLPLQLVYDSARAPVSAGHRGRPSAARRLVYMSTDHAVDLRIDPPSGGSTVLCGEIIGSANGPASDVPVFLLDGEEVTGYSVTGPLGDFKLETAGAARPRICLLLDGRRCLELPIEPLPAGRGPHRRG